jgi:hypothetical protein
MCCRPWRSPMWLSRVDTGWFHRVVYERALSLWLLACRSDAAASVLSVQPRVGPWLRRACVRARVWCVCSSAVALWRACTRALLACSLPFTVIAAVHWLATASAT